VDELWHHGNHNTTTLQPRLQQLVQFLVGINGSLETFAMVISLALMSMRFVIERTAEHTEIKSPFILQAYNFSTGITGILFEGCLVRGFVLGCVARYSALQSLVED
jgi:hypothetical protein